MAEEKQAASVEDSILFIRQGDQMDGYAEVTIAPDGSHAMAALYPPGPGGAFLTYTTLLAKLEDRGITTGILHEDIQNALLLANSTHSPVKNCIIARNSPPVTEIPEHYVIRKDLLERKPEIDPNAARIDWHSISAFSIVQAKEPIARRILKVEGKAGITIFGAEVPTPVQHMPVFTAGNNVISHEKGLFAGKSGRLAIDDKGEIAIEEVLVLKKGVDFTTGNITFPGDVILQGKIADGFKVVEAVGMAARATAGSPSAVTSMCREASCCLKSIRWAPYAWATRASLSEANASSSAAYRHSISAIRAGPKPMSGAEPILPYSRNSTSRTNN